MIIFLCHGLELVLILRDIYSLYTVTDVEGHLTPVAKVALDICNLPMINEIGHVIIHIAKQQRNYHTQQAMILADMFNRKNNCATLQVDHL